VIYTVTLNPALDRALRVDRLREEDTVRVSGETIYAAGKGIDVSRVIRELDGRSVALGLVGGYAGLQLEGFLINAGVMCDFIRIANETRTNLIIKEEETGRQYVISAAGPEINASEIGRLYQHFLQLQDMDFLVLSGSLPRGVTPNLYGQLILAGKKNRAFVLLDADGRALTESIAFGPDCIKPNLYELSRLVGRKLATEGEILEACRELHQRGVPSVLVSRGEAGLIFSKGEQRFKAVAPPVVVDSTVGAGDSAVAGFILALSQGRDLADCVRLACAAGTATARTPGTALCHKMDVEEILAQVRVEAL